jgi:outer membrane protein assembly factor BamE
VLRGAPALIALALATLLAACSVVRPYTLDIQQGVVLDQKMLARLKPGMTRNQVSLALGTPLLTDPLHADRWDYVYYTRTKGEIGQWRRLTVLFKEERLALVTGDVTVASAAAAAAAPTGSVPDSVGPDSAALPSSGLPAPTPSAPALPDASSPEK